MRGVYTLRASLIACKSSDPAKRRGGNAQPCNCRRTAEVEEGEEELGGWRNRQREWGRSASQRPHPRTLHAAVTAAAEGMLNHPSRVGAPLPPAGTETEQDRGDKRKARYETRNKRRREVRGTQSRRAGKGLRKEAGCEESDRLGPRRPQCQVQRVRDARRPFPRCRTSGAGK